LSDILTTLDLAVCVGGILLVMAVGMIASRKEDDTKDFFLAGRMIPWWAIAGSVFATNISSNHVVGFVGTGYREGFAQANFEFGAVAGLMVLGYFLMPLYRKMGVFTLSEFLGRRYDERARVLYWVVGLIMMVAIQIVATLYVGARTLTTLVIGTPFGDWLTRLGESIMPGTQDEVFIYYVGIAACASITGIYTVFGGLKAVIWTDTIQAVLLLVASAFIAILAIYHPAVGGLGNLIELEDKRFHVFFNWDHETLPWTGVLTGLMVLHFYYWGTNQFIVQRTLGARSDWDGRMGLIAAGFFKLIIPFTTVVAGMAAVHLLKAEYVTGNYDLLNKLCEPDGTLKNDNDTFTALATTLLPAGYGLMGIVLTGLIGAILSSLDSMMNSSSTLFTFDIYKRYMHKDAGERELLLVGRIAIVVVILIGGGMAALFQSKGNFFITVADNQSYIVGGVLVAFMVGIFWPAATGTGAVWCIGIYFLVAVVAQVLFNGVSSLPMANAVWPVLSETKAIPPPPEGLSTGLWAGVFEHKLNFMHRTAFAAIGGLIAIVLVSRITKRERDPEKEKLVWWRYRHSDEVIAARKDLPLWKDDRPWAVLLVACAIGLCIYFR